MVNLRKDKVETLFGKLESIEPRLNIQQELESE
jgi:hypothetical protein